MNNSFFKDEQIFLFHTGKYHHSYEMLGAHMIKEEETKGVRFSVWAPHAEEVSVVGDFNGWDRTKHKMIKISEGGIWSVFISGVQEGALYKYAIATSQGHVIIKTDPYAFFSEVRPNTASIVYSIEGYKWQDEAWIRKRAEIFTRPVNIYEVHLGSWRRHDDQELFNYKEIAKQLIPYVKEMGYTHIEILPIMEHPYDGSWGYQCSGYFSVTSRYGEPKDFMHLVEKCHENGIGVLLDWVPGHFCANDEYLSRFDGTMLFEKEQHWEWGTYKFDFSRSEVYSFLISNAVFWFEKYHIDGMRIDGVSSMLLLNHGKENREWTQNQFGGNEDLEAIEFMKQLNTAVFRYFPNVIMAAEEATAWPKVTWPVDDGGLGYNYKWNMGWMNDILRYMELQPMYRKYHHELITFSLMYAFSENFILAISHDEVVHGKKSLIEKMPGDYWQKFANLRAFFCFLMTHPGKKLIFMGAEFAQFVEWRYYCSLDWGILNFDMHKKFHEFVKRINHFYLKEEILWSNDHSWDGFQWLDVNNNEQNIISFIRKNKNQESIVVLVSFTPVSYDHFRIGVPSSGKYRLIFNSDQKEYGGTGNITEVEYTTEGIQCHGQTFSIELPLPSYSGIILKKEG